MPFEISWYIENKVIYSRVSTSVEIPDVVQAAKTITKYLYAGTPPVHLIMDTLSFQSRHTRIPEHVYLQTDFYRHLHLGHVIIVASNPLVSALTCLQFLDDTLVELRNVTQVVL
jgi:hypothetical protein